MRTTYNLPMEMRLATGEILKPVIGGTLDNKPFCDVSGQWMLNLEHEMIRAEARRRKLKYRRIGVLSRNLRGRYDLHGRLYRPNVWSFVQVNESPFREVKNLEERKALEDLRSMSERKVK